MVASVADMVSSPTFGKGPLRLVLGGIKCVRAAVTGSVLGRIRAGVGQGCKGCSGGGTMR